MFGCDKYNIKPDLVSIAKPLSSAYMPISVVLVTPEVSDVIQSQSNKLGFQLSRHAPILNMSCCSNNNNYIFAKGESEM
ncbi:unnamed protein product [Citrullus colocynthis]|uniref:Uncharacterized protein n=1 Tax=Citrullus colocynthis TaxID=252529 RepID=A0ABP0Z327_9ROSI